MSVAYLCVIAVQHFLNNPHGEMNTGNFPVLVVFNTVVCGVLMPSNMKNKRRKKASKVRKKNAQIFEPKMFGLPLYLRNAALSTPVKRGSNGSSYEMRDKRRKKREGKRERRKKSGIKSKNEKTKQKKQQQKSNYKKTKQQKKKKKKKKKKISMRIHVPTIITKTYLYNFDPFKPHFYIVKLGFTRVYIIFHISAQNIDCG